MRRFSHFTWLDHHLHCRSVIGEDGWGKGFIGWGGGVKIQTEALPRIGREFLFPSVLCAEAQEVNGYI